MTWLSNRPKTTNISQYHSVVTGQPVDIDEEELPRPATDGHQIRGVRQLLGATAPARSPRIPSNCCDQVEIAFRSGVNSLDVPLAGPRQNRRISLISQREVVILPKADTHGLTTPPSLGKSQQGSKCQTLSKARSRD